VTIRRVLRPATPMDLVLVLVFGGVDEVAVVIAEHNGGISIVAKEERHCRPRPI
jgi:uncharacterized membrane protein YcaP (DUF421 family)